MKKIVSALPIIIFILLAIVPFFWLKSGEMDLGGDSSRLYFYDPIGYLQNSILYNLTEGKGVFQPVISFAPFLLVLSLLTSILHSPYFLISLMNAIKISVSFLSVYLILKELTRKNIRYLSKEIACILAGLFYIFIPIMIDGYDRALPTHHQVFLNPLIFYLLLKYLQTFSFKYLWFSLLITLIFSYNFSWMSAPGLFAFYPLTLLFLFLYMKLIIKTKVSLHGYIIGFVFFIALQIFHIAPTILHLLEPGNTFSYRVFTPGSGNLDYFFGVLPLASISNNILLPSHVGYLVPVSFVIPFIIILGLIFRNRSDKIILLTAIFYLISFYLLTAKIGQVGIFLYTKLFLIPGFGMFRNFVGQWLFLYAFFYTLLFGQALFYVLAKIKGKKLVLVAFGIGAFLSIGAISFIKGELINKPHFQSNNVRTVFTMDPKFEDTLSFTKSLSLDGKILLLPFTDCCYQVLRGRNGGAYVGGAMFLYLAGKRDFPGYGYVAPFSTPLLEAVQNKDYKAVNHVLSLLNIHYIFHNTDSGIYDKDFPGYPYTYVRTFFPDNQEGYKTLVASLSAKKLFEKGHYNIYSLNSDYLLPHFYIAKTIHPYEEKPDYWESAKAFTIASKSADRRIGYIGISTCNTLFSKQECKKKSIGIKNVTPNIHFEKVNLSKYRVRVNGAKYPYILIFSESFDKNWKIFRSDTLSQNKNIVATYFNGEITEGNHQDTFFDKEFFSAWGKQPIANDRHFEVNGYANAWFIKPSDVGNASSYELIIELTNQRIIYISFAISLFATLLFFLWGCTLYLRRKRHHL